MNIKKFYLPLLIFFLILTIGLIIVNVKIRKNYQQNYGLVENMRVENILLKEGFFHSYDFATIPINFNWIFSDYKSNEVRFSDLIQGKTLILLINPNICHECYYDNILKIKNFEGESSLATIIIVEGFDEKEFKAFVLQNNIKDIAYHAGNGFYEGFRINPAVFFVVDEKLYSNCFYSPSNKFSTLTVDYFEKIRNMYR